MVNSSVRRGEIPDLLPNILFGVLSLLCIIGLHVARLVGLGYANPEGRLSVVIPGTMISIMALHTLSTHSWLVHKAAKKQDEEQTDNQEARSGGYPEGARSCSCLRQP